MNMSQSRNLLLLAVAISLSATSHAFSSEEAKDAKGGDPYVKLASVAMPIRNDKGYLINYIFLSVRLNLTPKADMSFLRDKEPYLRDILLRQAYHVNFSQAGHDDRLDESRFKSVMMVEFSKFTGPGKIASIEVSDVNSKIHY